MKSFAVVTLFPELIDAFSQQGLIGKAIQNKILSVETFNPRQFGRGVHQAVDDRPFGGGDGMILQAEPLAQSIEALKQKLGKDSRVVLMSPSGKVFNQQKAQKLALDERPCILVCGRYGGFDQRFIDQCVDEEISVGDYVLSGGELPACLILEACSRYIPDVLGHQDSVHQDSFSSEKPWLEEPQYTRPAVWRGLKVPDVLTSGHSAKIKKWKKEQSFERTFERRSDLLIPHLDVALVHHPILDRDGKIVATNITNFDIHDIARACRVYGVQSYTLVHPMEDQLMFVARILEHWRVGVGAKYNPSRKRALERVFTARTLEEAAEQRGAELIVGTHARPVAKVPEWTCQQLRREMFVERKKVLLVFGTGYGLTQETLQGCHAVLESLRGPPPDDFRHLSVRSAVSVYLDRLLGHLE